MEHGWAAAPGLGLSSTGGAQYTERHGSRSLAPSTGR